jgi:hypothetical protein
MERSRPETDRYRDTEYLYGSSRILLIQDVENEDAWIQSTAAVPIER